MGQGVDRVWRPPAPRVERARGPSPASFWRFGPDKGTSIDFGQATRAAGAAAAKEWSRSLLRCAPHTPPSISYACALARDTQVMWRRWRARERQMGGRSSRERGVCRVCQAGRRRRGRRQQRCRTSARGRRRRRAGGVDGGARTGRSTRGKTESGTALRGVSQNRVARGLTITSTSVDLPLSLPQSPLSLFT